MNSTVPLDLQLRPYLPLHSPSTGMVVSAVFMINNPLACQSTEPVLMLVGHSAAEELRETRPSQRPKYMEGGGGLMPRKASRIAPERRSRERDSTNTHIPKGRMQSRWARRECLPRRPVHHSASAQKRPTMTEERGGKRREAVIKNVHIYEHAHYPAALSLSTVACLRNAHLRRLHALHLHFHRQLLWLQVLILEVAHPKQLLHLRL